MCTFYVRACIFWRSEGNWDYQNIRTKNKLKKNKLPVHDLSPLNPNPFHLYHHHFIHLFYFLSIQMQNSAPYSSCPLIFASLSNTKCLISAIMKLLNEKDEKWTGCWGQGPAGKSAVSSEILLFFSLITFGEREVEAKWVLIVLGQYRASFTGLSHTSLPLHFPIKWKQEGSVASWDLIKDRTLEWQTG